LTEEEGGKEEEEEGDEEKDDAAVCIYRDMSTSRSGSKSRTKARVEEL
jgi:hypothetical protein